MEIEIRREWLIGALVVVVVLALGAVGWWVSPRGTDGRPVLLLPDVRAVALGQPRLLPAPPAESPKVVAPTFTAPKRAF